MSYETVKRTALLESLRQYHRKPVVKALTGMRRVGKSVALRQWRDVLTQECGPEQILYIDKESPDWDDVRDHKDLWERAHQLSSEELRIVLIDEVQQIDGWERAVAAMLGAGGFEVVITGSNAYVLSSELSTLLAGRYVSLPVWPLGFGEFMDLRERLGPTPESLELEFVRFCRYGGLPALHHFQWDHEVCSHYLKTVFDSVLFRDVVQRHGIRNASLLERVARFAFDSVGSPVSTKSITDFLKSQGLRTGQSTIQDHLDHLGSAFGIWHVQRMDIQGKRLLEFNGKYYAGDTGIRNALSGFRDNDLAKTLENLVYLELRRRGYAVFVGKVDQFEIDFVAERNGTRTYCQVAWKVESPETLERELRPLRLIRDKHPCVVISMDPWFNGTLDGINHLRIEDFLLGAEL